MGRHVSGEGEGYLMTPHTTRVQDCFSSEGDYYAPICETCNWEAVTTDNRARAESQATEHSLTGSMFVGQDWEE